MVNDTQERIERLLDRAEARIAQVFRLSIRALRESVDLEKIERLLILGRGQEAIEELIEAAQQLGAASSVVFIQSAEATNDFLRAAGVGVVSFDRVNFRAVDTMRSNQLRLIREVGDEQRRAVRVALVDGIARGLGPREQARAFRDSIGLTARQSRAVANYRRLLQQAGNPTLPEAQQAESLTRALRDGRGDKAVRAAIRARRPIPAGQIEAMVARYYNRSVKHRATTIARTESLSAVHQGVEEAFEQAIDAGKFTRAQLDETWLSAGDGRVRDSHSRLNGTKRPESGVWQGLESAIRFPGDPSAAAGERIACRCVIVRRIRSPEKLI